MDFLEYQDIYVFVEQTNGKIHDVSFELLGEARRLVEQINNKNYQVCAVLLGDDVLDKGNELIYFGADKVIISSDPLLNDYNTDIYTFVLDQIIKTYKPDCFLIGATLLGRDLAPRIAARCNTGLTADATHLAFEDSTLLVTRPAFGGNLFGTIVCEDHRPQMASIRPGVMEAINKDETRQGEVINFTVDLANVELRTKIIKVMEKVKTGVDITKADIILAGGRGVCKNFDLLHEVAAEIGGVVAATRAAVDEGYADKDIQVGQTGKTVRPKVYIACGISGAVQHLAGMEKSDLIIAINTDKTAPIFKIANIGIVGNAVEILPILKEELIHLR